VQFASFREFYPYYLSEHRNVASRRLHFAGSTLVLLLLAWGIVRNDWRAFAAMPLAGYGCAWIGHFLFEKNRPATFSHPFYSLLGDWVMYGQMLSGKLWT
jgi:hypothetical protein